MLNKKRINKTNIKKNKSFLLKLFDILNEKKYNEIICWNAQGTSVVIKDANKFSELVLPNYYTHNNYKSFIRQLNLYGFTKKKNNINEGEEFVHDKFSKNISKEQINQIMRKGKGQKVLLNYIKNNNNNIKDNQKVPDINENDVFNILLNKNENGIKDLSKLRQQVEELKSLNKNLKDQLSFIKKIFNGQSIFLSKIINNKKKDNINNNKKQKNKKINNLKELFKHYLYNCRIYSPYLA